MISMFAWRDLVQRQRYQPDDRPLLVAFFSNVAMEASVLTTRVESVTFDKICCTSV